MTDSLPDSRGEHPLVAAEVLVTSDVPADADAAIVRAFREAGIVARTRMVPTRRGADELQWVVLVSLPLQAFLTGLGVVVAEDVAQRIKWLTARVLRAVGRHPSPASPPRPLVLQDAGTRLQIVLEPDLPPHAYRALFELDLSEFRYGPLHYDRRLGRWRSELDEAGA